MPRLLLMLTILAATLPVLGGVLVAAAVGGQGRVYTVAELSRIMMDDPRSLVDRVVRVRGVVVSNVLFVIQDPSGSPASAFALEDAATGDRGAASILTLGRGREVALWATLRRLPLLSAWVPAPQQVVYDRPATYRVRVEVLGGSCRIACSEWLVLVGGVAR
jgi:hypothetical protein